MFLDKNLQKILTSEQKGIIKEAGERIKRIEEFKYNDYVSKLDKIFEKASIIINSKAIQEPENSGLTNARNILQNSRFMENISALGQKNKIKGMINLKLVNNFKNSEEIKAVLSKEDKEFLEKYYKESQRYFSRINLVVDNLKTIIDPLYKGLEIEMIKLKETMPDITKNPRDIEYIKNPYYNNETNVNRHRAIGKAILNHGLEYLQDSSIQSSLEKYQKEAINILIQAEKESQEKLNGSLVIYIKALEKDSESNNERVFREMSEAGSIKLASFTLDEFIKKYSNLSDKDLNLTIESGELEKLTIFYQGEGGLNEDGKFLFEQKQNKGQTKYIAPKELLSAIGNVMGSIDGIEKIANVNQKYCIKKGILMHHDSEVDLEQKALSLKYPNSTFSISNIFIHSEDEGKYHYLDFDAFNNYSLSQTSKLYKNGSSNEGIYLNSSEFQHVQKSFINDLTKYLKKESETKSFNKEDIKLSLIHELYCAGTKVKNKELEEFLKDGVQAIAQLEPSKNFKLDAAKKILSKFNDFIGDIRKDPSNFAPISNNILPEVKHKAQEADVATTKETQIKKVIMESDLALVGKDFVSSISPSSAATSLTISRPRSLSRSSLQKSSGTGIGF